MIQPRRRVCDFCGRELRCDDGDMKFEIKGLIFTEGIFIDRWKKMDMCFRCRAEFRYWLRNNMRGGNNADSN